MPVTTGIFTGLAWGLLGALLEGLPLLLVPSAGAHPALRWLALAYLATIYGFLGIVAGAIVGAFALIAVRASRRSPSRAALTAACSGLFAAAMILAAWTQRLSPTGAVKWLIVVLLALTAGVATGWLLNRAIRGGRVPWKLFHGAVLALLLLSLVTVASTAAFRSFLRDKPLFNPPATTAAATPEQPNILLITAGGLRPDHLGAYGYSAGGEAEISPAIDALAVRGVRFDQAISQASWAEPSLASLFTSLHPSELGIRCQAAITCQPHLDEQRLTLAEALQGAGYRTQAYVTSPWLAPELGFSQGFDGFQIVREQAPFDAAPMRSRTLGWLLGCGRDSAACDLFLKGHALLFDEPIPQGWGGDHVNGRVTRFLELHRNERFFLWIHYTEALPPYNLEPPFRPMPEGPLASAQRRLARLGYWELGDPFTAREVLLPLDSEGLSALYDGEVHRVDRLVGGLTGLLDGLGLSGRTVVVFTSDHGQELAEHGGYTYGHSLYDELLRVPLIIAGPGVNTPGTSIGEPVALLDLAPTLAEIAGTGLSPEAQGRSLLPALQGEPLAQLPIFSESLYRNPHELKAIRQDGYKLVYNPDGGSFELYDLGRDPTEQQNRIEQEPLMAEKLAGTLFDWMARVTRTVEELPRSAPPAEIEDAAW